MVRSPEVTSKAAEVVRRATTKFFEARTAAPATPDAPKPEVASGPFDHLDWNGIAKSAATKASKGSRDVGGYDVTKAKSEAAASAIEALQGALAPNTVKTAAKDKSSSNGKEEDFEPPVFVAYSVETGRNKGKAYLSVSTDEAATTAGRFINTPGAGEEVRPATDDEITELLTALPETMFNQLFAAILV